MFKAIELIEIFSLYSFIHFYVINNLLSQLEINNTFPLFILCFKDFMKLLMLQQQSQESWFTIM